MQLPIVYGGFKHRILARSIVNRIHKSEWTLNPRRLLPGFRFSPFSDRYELLARIASLYFEDGLSQAEIATQTGYSRSMISRLLTEARQQQIVEIRINHPLSRNRELEQSLEQLLNLTGVRVLTRGSLNYSTMLRRIGTLGARLMEELLRDHTVVGVSWGTAVWEVVNAARGGRGTTFRSRR